MTRKEQIEAAHYEWAKEMAKLIDGPPPTERALRSLGRVPFFYAAEWADKNPVSPGSQPSEKK